MTTRGIRNLNPCNIRISTNHWLGKVTPSRDADFETFDTMEHGIRAAAMILLNYSHRGINTLRGIIQTWAPATENDTAAYVEDAADRTGYEPDAILDLSRADDLKACVYAILCHENGPDAASITDNQMHAGVANALASIG